MKLVIRALALVLVGLSSIAGVCQSQTLTRDQEREQLRQILDGFEKKIETRMTTFGLLHFRQSEKNPYNFVAIYRWEKNKNVYYFEVVVSSTNDHTIGFRIYPHYNNTYMNVGKAVDKIAFMRKMLDF